MSLTVDGAMTPARSRINAALLFVAAGAAGIALTVAGELSTPFDLANAIAVTQQGLIALGVVALLLSAGLMALPARRPVLVLLAVLTPLTSVAYFLPVGWIAGCAGVALAWTAGALGAGRPTGGLRLERICGLVCGFTAAAWFLVYASSLLADLL